jgi:hypothetical protein
MQDVSRSEIKVSPLGVQATQKVFDLYSTDGKLTLSQIKNIGKRISPIISDYLEKLKIEETPGKRYSAVDFFSFLGESNRTLYWSLTYDLQTEAGWRKVLTTEFYEADPGLIEETLRRMRQVLELIQAPGGQDKFLALALTIGGAFNVIEAFTPTLGSVAASLMKQTQFAFSTSIPASEGSEESERLMKLLLVTQYALIDQQDKVLVIDFDRIARWNLDGVKKIMSNLYPGIKFPIIEKIYHDNVLAARSKAQSSTEEAHKYIHKKAWTALGKFSDSDLNWSAYESYEFVSSVCKDLTPRITVQEWIKYFDEKLAALDYTDAEFCNSLKLTQTK